MNSNDYKEDMLKPDYIDVVKVIDYTAGSFLYANRKHYHKWKLIGALQPTRREEKKEVKLENSSSTSKSTSSFLDKLGIVGTIIKVVWFPFKIVLKIGNWLGGLLSGNLFR